MKLNKYFMLGLAGLAFAACSNEEGVPEVRKQDKAIIRLSLGKAETRGLGESVATKYNKINDLVINFYNAQGNYVDIPDTYTDENGTYDNVDAIKTAVTDLQKKNEATLEIKGVPNYATQVYIVANQPAQTGNEEGIDMSSIGKAKASHILLSSQKDCLNSTLTSMDTGEIEEGDVINATLTPVTCRFELKDFTAKQKPADWAGAEIKSFEVKGIYINRFYPWGILSGQEIEDHYVIARGNDRDNYSADKYKAIEYTYNNTTKEYDFSYMCDDGISTSFTYVTTGLVDETYICTAKPTETNKWWGYQLLPGNAPHLVIKLDVIYDDGVGKKEEKYLVVQKYKDGETNLDKTARGNVYQIDNLIFDASNLVDVPYEGTKTVSAQIRVLAWRSVPITPDFSK
ncbi:hypothetical protein [uncultured Bacteroides sp.]|uniref:hypothetical protein n=1 Tax=uncultured Bacteroides sp. TaxID=162156 RepID=UPI0025DA8C22|nr:hypothetical protein [uncultured Bacteroides sp.]